MATPNTSETKTSPRETEVEREARLTRARHQAMASIRRSRLRVYRQNEEAERYEALLGAAADWAHAARLRTFLRATEARLAEGGAPPHAAEWLKWAWTKAEALDPLATEASLKWVVRPGRRRRVPDDALPPFSIFDLR